MIKLNNNNIFKFNSCLFFYFLFFFFLFLNFFLVKTKNLSQLFFKIYFIVFTVVIFVNLIWLLQSLFKNICFANGFQLMQKFKQFYKIFKFGFEYYLIESVETLSYYVWCVLMRYQSSLSLLLSFLVYCVLLSQFIYIGEITLVSPFKVNHYNDLYPILPEEDSNSIINDKPLTKEECSRYIKFLILLAIIVNCINTYCYPR